MTPEQMRIAIAEHLGWKRRKDRFGWEWTTPDGRTYKSIPGKDAVHYFPPDYPSDLNSMHEAEKMLTREQQDDYANHLYPMLPCDENHGPCGAGEEDIMTASMFQVMHATAAQRAEAFLRTIGKWTDERKPTT